MRKENSLLKYVNLSFNKASNIPFSLIQRIFMIVTETEIDSRKIDEAAFALRRILVHGSKISSSEI
jgi:hypothetical protein